MFVLLGLIGSLASAKDILPYPIYQSNLPNGLKVVTIPYDSPGLASFYVVVRVGSREETLAGKTGFAHFFEHMMFRGTDKYPKDKYADLLKSTGASANANTSLDRTVYHMTGNAAELETMFDLESDRFQNLKYSIQAFKTEAGAVKGEYTKNNSSPYSRLNEATANAAFSTHTYKHTTMGFFDDIVDMPNQYDFSLQFFKNFYRPEYCTIIVVGDVTQDKVNALADKYFGKWERGNYKVEIPVEPEQKETQYAHVKMANFPPYIEMDYKSPAFSLENNDYQALSILSQILFSDRSDLYKKLVVDEKLVREIDGSTYPTRDPYLFGASASLISEKDMGYVKKEIERVIEDAKKTPIKQEIINETKERIRYSFAMSMDSPDAIANSVAAYVWVTGDPNAINKNYAIYDKVTAEDLMRVAKLYLVPQKLTIATISSGDQPSLD